MRNTQVSASLARITACGVLVAAFAWSSASPASAAGCTVDPASHQATAFAADTDNFVTISSDGTNLRVNGVSCAALNGIDSMIIDMSALSGGRVNFDLGNGGQFAPGLTNEGDGSSEIEFSIVGQSFAGTVQVIGTTQNDTITIGQGGGSNQINFNAGADGASPDVDVTFAITPTYLAVDGIEGDDIVTASGVLATSTPYAGALQLDGGPGANELTGGAAGDELRVTVEISSSGAEVLHGGDGLDQLVILSEASDLTSYFSIDDIANDGVGCPGLDCEGTNVGTDIELVRGSDAAETLVGSELSDILIGGGGDDALYGRGGTDTLQCSGGKAFGEDGIDFINVEVGCAVASGGSQRDTALFLSASRGVTVTLDGAANDGVPTTLMNVRADIEQVVGSSYGDSLTGNDRRNVLEGGYGRDELFGGGGNDRLEGQGGSDSLNGELANDKLLGGPGDDALDGGDGVDSCSQGPGVGSLANCE